MHRPLVMLTLVALAASSACARSHTPSPPADAAVDAQVERVAVAMFPETFESGGVVRARATATIASRVTAPVEAVMVSAGALVRKGQTLVTLEARELDANAAHARASLAATTDAARAAEAEIAAAEAALTLARATSERIKTLFDKRSATAQEWDQASSGLQAADARVAAVRARAASVRAERDAAQAAVRAAQITLAYATIAAPFDGVVAERLVDPGTMATAGMPLIVVEDPSELRLHVQVDEFRARSISAGHPASARIHRDAAWTPARIVEIGRVDSTSHNFLVKLEVPANPENRSGLFGRARFTSGERRTLAVPAASVVRRGQLAYVFALTADRVARLRPVVVGEAVGDRIEILAGVFEGDVVIVKPPPTLTDGARIAGQP